MYTSSFSSDYNIFWQLLINRIHLSDADFSVC